jgi:serine O-acetyltransferase
MSFADLVKLDIRRYSSSYTKAGIALLLSHPGFRFMYVFRLCNRFSKFHPAGILARLWFMRMKVKYGFQIPHTTRIGGGLFLGHFGNIVINARTTIGQNCNIAQGVTIGQMNIGNRAGCPIIGDRVWIGCNAVVVGKIEIGDNALIAPLSFVNFNVPANSLVMGNPAKIVSTKGSLGYVNNYE